MVQSQQKGKFVVLFVIFAFFLLQTGDKQCFHFFFFVIIPIAYV